MNIILTDKYAVWNRARNPPRVLHDTFEDAQAEAERLARKQPNDVFHVVYFATRNNRGGT